MVQARRPPILWARVPWNAPCTVQKQPMPDRLFLGDVLVPCRRLILALSIGAACATSAQAQERADLALTNGVIFPANGSAAVYSTLVVRDGRVLALGGAELLERYRADRLINLQGRLAVPGFNDTRMAIRPVPLWNVDLTGSRSIDEIDVRIRRKAELLEPGA